MDIIESLELRELERQQGSLRREVIVCCAISHASIEQVGCLIEERLDMPLAEVVVFWLRNEREPNFDLPEVSVETPIERRGCEFRES